MKCKYPDSMCVNMTILGGVAYCDSVPCSLRGEIPKPTNANRLRAMSNEELAKWLAYPICKHAKCRDDCHVLSEVDCVTNIQDWLSQSAEENGNEYPRHF